MTAQQASKAQPASTGVGGQKPTAGKDPIGPTAKAASKSDRATTGIPGSRPSQPAEPVTPTRTASAAPVARPPSVKEPAKPTGTAKTETAPGRPGAGPAASGGTEPTNPAGAKTETTQATAPVGSLATGGKEPAKSAAATTSPASPATTAPFPPPPPISKSWAEIKAGSLVIAHESIVDGWWEAIVLEVNGDKLTLRWRDYPREPTVVRGKAEIAFLAKAG